jgi:hypothetical protein
LNLLNIIAGRFNPKDRKSKAQDVNRDSGESGRFIRVFFSSNLGFVLDFEFRVSDFSAQPSVSRQKGVRHAQLLDGERTVLGSVMLA